MSTLPPPTLPAPSASYTCPYCRLESDASGTSCPHCGAPVDLRAKVSTSGWQAQPAIKDLARIQFGQSTCQMSGINVPAAEFRLAAGDGLFFPHHALLWAIPGIELGNQPLKGAWNRVRAGLPIIMMQAKGPGAIALSGDHSGESIAVPITPDRGIDVREHRFITATLNVTYSWFQTGIWYTTRNDDETETHYPAGNYLDRFEAQDTPGLLILHSPGNVFVRDLGPGEAICVHPGAFLWKDESVQMGLHLEHPGGSFWSTGWQPASPFARFVGPGRVAVSSAYEKAEGTGRISSSSPATRVDWGRQGYSVAKVVMAGAKADDSQLREAVGAFLGERGFSESDHNVRGPAATTTFIHPNGLVVSVMLVSGSAVTNMAQNVAGMFGGSKIARKLAEKAGGLGNVVGKAMARGGKPVEGFGVPAIWDPEDGECHLALTKDQQQIVITVKGKLSTDDQWAWAANIGRAALG